MFKRKEAMPPTIGSICMIKREVSETLNATDYYRKYSGSLEAERTGYDISNGMYGKKAGRKQLLFADCLLVLVTKESNIKGLVNVIPLAIRNDSIHGAAIKRYIGVNRKKLFTTSLDSLSLSSEANTESVLESAYVHIVKTDIISYLNEIRNQSTHI